MFSAELDSNVCYLYHLISDDMSVQHSVAFIETISNGVFSLIFANEVGRYLLILIDRRDVEGEFHHIDIVPMSGNISVCMA